MLLSVTLHYFKSVKTVTRKLQQSPSGDEGWGMSEMKTREKKIGSPLIYETIDTHYKKTST